MEVKYGNRRLINRGPSDRGRHVVGSHYVVVITQRPKQLLRNGIIIVDDQDSGLHGESLLTYSYPGDTARCVPSARECSVAASGDLGVLAGLLPVDSGRRKRVICPQSWTKWAKIKEQNAR